MNARLHALLLSAAFLLTGVGTALLGAALPAMLAEWHLSDRNGGWLLFSAFAGSTLGALLVHGALRLLAILGLASSAVAALVLSSGLRGPFYPAFLLYGTGLGLTMTAISMIRSREVSPADSNLEMNRLNLLWAAGACCAPALSLHSLRLISVSALFRTGSIVLAITACGLLLETPAKSVILQPLPAPKPDRPARFAPLSMCFFAAAAVGLESTIGSWLTTYTARVAHGTGIAVWANSAFWAGLLLSRGAHSLRVWQHLHPRTGAAAHLVAVTLAMGLLVMAPFEAVLPMAALIAGVGLGPLYPLVLSLALPRYRSTAVFVMAGIGSSLLPWLTGVFSTSLRSLRGGLLVPCASVVLLVVSALWMRREIPAHTQVPA